MKQTIQIRKQFTHGMFSKEFNVSEDRKNLSNTQKQENEQQNQDLSNCNFKVAIRIRPPNEREIPLNTPFQSTVLS